MSQKNPTPTIFEFELPNVNHLLPTSMARSDAVLKMAFFVCTNRGFHTLEGLKRPAVDSRSTSVVRLRLYGCDGSDEEGQWHEN